MKILNANITPNTFKFLQENVTVDIALESINELIKRISGIESFFETTMDLQEFKKELFSIIYHLEEPDRTEYGDFQTNLPLAVNVTKYLSKHLDSPEIVIEPTCGKGNFIIAALTTFYSIKKIYGIEIYKPYVLETKLSILDFFLLNPNRIKPEIKIVNSNVFEYDFKIIASLISNEKILIIGNPPWVTNSTLGSLESNNLPSKSNFKKVNGLDAITGKGNFDIAEYILILMITAFQDKSGNIAFLVKNSVIKNIVFDQTRNNYKIGEVEKHCIDSKKEFDVTVDSSLFFCELNHLPSYECKEFNFYQNTEPLLNFGWSNKKFVSNIDCYAHSHSIDDTCPFEWRQGLKHDCASVMELEKTDNFYINALNEKFDLEEGLVYGILKSSDLKNSIISSSRKYTIVTQNRVGQDTSYIKTTYPKTYEYLSSHKNFFELRKSSIYRGKPSFSIFGIGDYSFKPFKVVISGLYKTFHFSLVLPENKKPIMLDDTCYLLGFDNLEYAIYALILLNSKMTKDLLKSITFSDSKRIFTKDVLMRIDLMKVAQQFSIDELNNELVILNRNYNLDVKTNSWDSFNFSMGNNKNKQLEMLI